MLFLLPHGFFSLQHDPVKHAFLTIFVVYIISKLNIILCAHEDSDAETKSSLLFYHVRIQPLETSWGDSSSLSTTSFQPDTNLVSAAGVLCFSCKPQLHRWF